MAAGYVDTNGVRLWHEELGRPDGARVLLVMGGGASVVWWPPELLQGLVIMRRDETVGGGAEDHAVRPSGEGQLSHLAHQAGDARNRAGDSRA